MARNKDDDFDGYRKWLGIPETKRPPTHYQLLAVSLDEDDPEVIRAAAEQRRQYVGSKRGEGHDAAVTEIVYRINEAEATLLNQEMRRDYDRQMKLFEKRRKKRQVDPFATRSDVSSPSRMVAGEDTGIVKTFAGIMAVIVVGFGVMAWFSFSLPWSKPAQQVEAAVQPPAPLAAPVQIAQLPEKAPVVEPEAKQVIPQPVENPPAEPVKPKIEDENPAELIAITELSPFTGFGISDDGLTIYFDKKGGEIWSAHRKAVEARFANEKSMQLNGRQPTLSADELEIIFLSERSDRKKGESFYVAKRDTKDGPFRRPAEITELLDKSGITTYKNAFLSANGRELTFNTYTGSTSSLQTTIRPTLKARWSRPVSLPHGVDQHSNLTWPFVSANGSLLLCFEAQDKQNRLTAWHRNSIEEPFAFRRAVSLPGTDTISGRCPRYVAATDELFFLRFIEPFVFQLSCIRNFTSALPIAANLKTEYADTSFEKTGGAVDGGKRVEQPAGTPNERQVGTTLEVAPVSPRPKDDLSHYLVTNTTLSGRARSFTGGAPSLKITGRNAASITAIFTWAKPEGNHVINVSGTVSKNELSLKNDNQKIVIKGKLKKKGILLVEYDGPFLDDSVEFYLP